LAETCDISTIQSKLSSYRRRTLAATPRVAAVLLLLIPSEEGFKVILTKRVRTLDSHGGEVSFPGGSVDSGESLCGAVLRETCEEIGLCGDSVQLLGMLDDEISRWGHRVTPFVGVAESADFRIQESEVEQIYDVPLNHFISKTTYWTEVWFRGDDHRTVHFYKWQRDIVWGLTALILKKFTDILAKE